MMPFRNPIDLTTRAIVKDWLTITDAKHDEKLQRLITAASREFHSDSGRGMPNGLDLLSPFNQAIAYTETLMATYNGALFPTNYPILSIQSLTVDGVPLAQSAGPGLPGYQIDDDSDSLTIEPPNQYRRNLGPFYSRQCRPQSLTRQCVITYTAGYPAIQITAEPAVASADVITAKTPFLADMGVTAAAGGAAFTAVAANPLVNQYTIDTEGNYVFSATDTTAATAVLLNYTVANTPDDLVMAITQIVALTFTRRQWTGLSSQMQAGIGQTNYLKDDYPPSVKKTLSRYRGRTYNAN